MRGAGPAVSPEGFRAAARGGGVALGWGSRPRKSRGGLSGWEGVGRARQALRELRRLWTSP